MTVFSNSIRGTSRASAMSPIVSSYSPSAGKLCSATKPPRVPKGMPSSRCCCRPVPGAPLGGSEITMLAGSP